MAGYLSEKYFKDMVRSVMMPKCLVSLNDINNSNTIFGPNVLSLKVKMVRRKTKPVISNYVNIPKEILQLHKMVLVAADTMFVNRVTFLVSIPRHVKFTKVQYIGKSTMVHISKSLENINGVYYRRGMYVETFYMDREFENIRRIIPGR